MENGYSNPVNGESTATDHLTHLAAPSALNHRRSPSSSLLSRLPFLRSQAEELAPQDDAEAPGEEPLHHGLQQRDGDGGMAAIRQHKTRKRKGSLRKTALLSTGRLKFERRTSVAEYELQKSPPPPGGELSPDAELEMDYPSSAWALPPPNRPLKIDTLTNGAHPPQDHQLLSPDSITSPTSRYASTTDDDGDGGIHLSITSAADLTRRRSTLRNPIVASPARGTPPPPAHSYSETEWWGWIILLTTWIVFVVGMGSCLGVWSWAWDVGETPYAPPELEDDPTLPIVGYYPALIVMTGVMAWVWVVVAWVGMKYFRHARFEIGDGEES